MRKAKMKCGECGKEDKVMRFRTPRLIDLQRKKFVVAIPICVKCSKRLVKQSGKFFRSVGFFNRRHYRIQLAELLFFSAVVVLFTSLGIIFAENGRHPIILSFFAVGALGLFFVLNTLKKYGF